LEAFPIMAWRVGFTLSSSVATTLTEDTTMIFWLTGSMDSPAAERAPSRKVSSIATSEVSPREPVVRRSWA